MRTFCPGLCVVALCCLATPAFSASYFSFDGTFSSDDDQVSFLFSISAPGAVELQSWSYAGGVNPLGQVIPGGGFAPVLSLFDSAGNLLGFDNGGTVGGVPPNDCGTGGRTLDSISGFCLDAYLQTALNAGQYLVVLTQQDNTPNGPMLADGFALAGTGNFTGGPFIDAGGFLRTSSYSFTIGPVDAASPSEIPEPGTALLFLSALAGAGIRNYLQTSKTRRCQK